MFQLNFICSIYFLSSPLDGHIICNGKKSENNMVLYQIHVVPVPLRMLLYSVLEIMLCSIILNTESKWKLACSFIAQYWLRVTTTDSELFVWYSNIWSCWDFLSQWTSGLIVSLSFLLKVNLFLSGILMNMLWL